MSAQEKDDKTEKATPQKLREARNKGQVAKSQEMSHWLVLTVFSLAAYGFSDGIADAWRQMSEKIFVGGIQIPMQGSNMIRWFAKLFEDIVMAFFPLLLCLIVIAVLANVLQTGFLLSTHPIKPNFTKLNPVSGFKRVFSKKIFFELFKVMLKMALFVWLVFYGVSAFTSNVISLHVTGRQDLFDAVVSKVTGPLLALLCLLLPLALLDFVYSRREFADKMKMSKQDIKEEHKRNEGHPELKSKRKELQKELLNATSSMGNVKDADMIITNPTHYAVALKYDQAQLGLPVVIAKGKGEMAAKIRALSRKYSKPIVRKPALARMLYAQCAVDQVIPKESIADVAALYRWLFSLNQKVGK